MDDKSKAEELNNYFALVFQEGHSNIVGQESVFDENKHNQIYKIIFTPKMVRIQIGKLKVFSSAGRWYTPEDSKGMSLGS